MKAFNLQLPLVLEAPMRRASQLVYNMRQRRGIGKEADNLGAVSLQIGVEEPLRQEDKFKSLTLG